ncbi:RsmD family RNA methyltransferase [Suttonella sp. R2A3]|uniref:TRAM domain-containing protein n=1 Tax=Suttonella sp. R2A3 TaxID=2908648 RepID=UPI001F456291|nr:TRAM domain-containing protein [Suttonella sp. R2A3]UJF24145.1 RsmD family RNA methyltransferase [Suttonella sp. R2A3]
MNQQTTIESLDYQGRGVAKVDGQAIFIAGALPEETVRYRITHQHKRFAEGAVDAVINPAEVRVTPRCVYYADCGGCDLQHAESGWQTQAKENLWRAQLKRLGGVIPETIAPALSGDPWHYRHRARLSVAYVGGRVLLGFKARQSHHVVDVDECVVLAPEMSDIFPKIRELLQNLLPQRVHEVSLQLGEGVLAVGLQVKRWSKSSSRVGQAWIAEQPPHWQLWLREDRTASYLLAGQRQATLQFRPHDDLAIPFTPDDFTQVNRQMNQAMVRQALSWLAVEKDHAIVDLFCGLGNFSLPLVRAGAQVLAIEGVSAMVARLKEHAQTLGLSERISARRADLFSVTAKDINAWTKADAWLIDPPRAGAQALVSALADAHKRPERLLYVSCNPATLARDGRILIEQGYRATRGGIINMFPQTAHIESMVLFER